MKNPLAPPMLRPLTLAFSPVIGALPVSAQETAPPAKLSSELVAKITRGVDKDTERLQTIFKDIHQHPELGFMETRMAGLVASELEALGYQVQTGIGGTGVVGILRNGDGPTVMFRADMDANPAQEATGLPYASQAMVKLPDGSETPVAHLCGHDAHTTWLISLARTMATLREHWSGTLVLLALAG